MPRQRPSTSTATSSGKGSGDRDESGDEDREEEDGSSDSSSTEEEVWTVDDERNFFRTLGALQAENPCIYDPSERFFRDTEPGSDKGSADTSAAAHSSTSSRRSPTKRKVKREEEEEEEEGKDGPPKRMFLRDYERKLMLERGGRTSDTDGDDDEAGQGIVNGSTAPRRGDSTTYVAQERRLKREFKAAIAEAGLDDDDDGDEDGEETGGGDGKVITGAAGLLKKRVKTKEELDKEQADYFEWLLSDEGGGAVPAGQSKKDLRKLRDRWTRDELLDSDERFLRDYFLSTQYDTDDATRVPSYKEVVGEDEGGEEEERLEQFEHKYNFRFEEPDQDFIKQYPRTVNESVRSKPPSRRKQKRDEEKALRREELESTRKRREQLEEEEQDPQAFRFKYRNVPANNFGLSVDEILKAEDAQLNAWAPISRVNQYRDETEEQREVAYFERRAKDAQCKKKIFHAAKSAQSTPSAPKTTTPAVKEDPSVDSPKEEALEANAASGDRPKKTKKDKKNRRLKHLKRAAASTDPALHQLDTARLQSYGVGTKKLKRLVYNKKKAAASRRAE